MKIQQIIETHWYDKINFILSIVLFPFSIIFFILSTSRKLLYKLGILRSYKLPVPVIIVGNIGVGGVGKTPLTKHIAQQLIAQGIKVGIILRGYKGRNKNPTIVTATSNSVSVGDEALIYAQNSIPVAIGRNRYLAGCLLLKEYPDLQIILSDDGLQHYRLKRDYEIVVMDQTRMLGNKFVVPMGPLREPPSRLRSVNAIVINGSSPWNTPRLYTQTGNLDQPGNNILVEHQSIILNKIYNPVTQTRVEANHFTNLNVCAMVAMGNPERFFKFIAKNAIQLNSKIIYPDHHHYTKDDVPDNFDAILVTEKDYTKLGNLNNDKIWVVQVEVQLEPNVLIKQISGLINDSK